VIGLSDMYVTKPTENGLIHQSCAPHVNVTVFHCAVPLKVAPTRPEFGIVHRPWHAVHISP
jgi:hypothetical protein